MDLKSTIRTVSNFPKKGIHFKDITTLLKDANALRFCVDSLYSHYCDKRIDKVVGIESRGFIIGSALAYRLGIGFVPIRKPGKLPAETLSQKYQLEYGEDSMEIHKDSITMGERVLIHDDVLATGGTMDAACKMVAHLGGEIIGLSFILELAFLQPRNKVKNYDIYSLITYDTQESK